MKQKSPWEILSLLYESDSQYVNLTVHERSVLAVIITHVNGEGISKDGYKAWPSTDTIIRRSGVGESTTERSITKLVKDGWMSKESGKGKGSSNTYYINADKIVQAAALSGVKASDRKTGKTVVVEAVELHKRNTAGLVQNKPKQPVAPPLAQYDSNLDDPFAEAVAVPQKALESNYTGYRKQHYGQWCYSEEEYQLAVRKHETEMRAMDDDPDCPF